MSASRDASATGRWPVVSAGAAALSALVLSGGDAADPHVPAVVGAPAPLPPASPPHGAASQSGLAPPKIHTVG